jgi:hypothetical protein
MTLAFLGCSLSALNDSKEHIMEEQRQVNRRRRGLVAAVLGAAALAVALPVSGAFAGDGSSGSSASGTGAGSVQVQNEQGPAPRDGDCPSERGGQGDAPEDESAVEL